MIKGRKITDKGWFFVLIALWLYISLPSLGELEGKFFPVAEDFTVETVSEIPNGISLEGTFNIERPSCSFNHLQWYLKKNDRQSPIHLTFGDGTNVRTGREQHYENWQLDIKLEDFPYVYALVYHQCPYRPYLTVTPLYNMH